MPCFIPRSRAGTDRIDNDVTRHVARGAAFGDLDDDGELDIVVSHMDGAPAVLLIRHGADGCADESPQHDPRYSSPLAQAEPIRQAGQTTDGRPNPGMDE
jgi:hypothetical protein